MDASGALVSDIYGDIKKGDCATSAEGGTGGNSSSEEGTHEKRESDGEMPELQSQGSTPKQTKSESPDRFQMPPTTSTLEIEAILINQKNLDELAKKASIPEKQEDKPKPEQFNTQIMSIIGSINQRA